MLSMLQVIWAIGWSLIVLAAVIHLPLRAIVLLSVATIALHNTLDGIQVTTFAGPGTPIPGFGASMWKILHERGLIFPFGSTGPAVFVLYPLVPWIARHVGRVRGRDRCTSEPNPHVVARSCSLGPR